MNKITWILLAVTSVSTGAFAADRTPPSEEVTKCWFSQKDLDESINWVKCDVTLIEDSVSDLRGPKKEKVSLNVDCHQFFQLEDKHAVQVDKGNDEFNLGTEDGKIALLKIKDEARVNGEQHATLIISKNERKTVRLEGKCKRQLD